MVSSGVNSSDNTHGFMALALQQAQLAMDNLEVPFGCVIVEDGNVISSGRNRTNETRNATRHAEMEAVDYLFEQRHKNGLSNLEAAEKFSKCILYVTCEPCIMCASALSFLGMKEVFNGCANEKFGGCGSIFSLHSSNSNQLSGGIMADEAISLFRSFYEQGNPNGMSNLSHIGVGPIIVDSKGGYITWMVTQDRISNMGQASRLKWFGLWYYCHKDDVGKI